MRSLCSSLIALSLVAMAGCESYALRGTVISGNESMVTLVSDDDPRLDLQGMSGVTLDFRLDPQSLGSKSLGQSVTQPDGAFKMPIDVFGAGTLEYQLGVLARSPGYNSAQGVVKMPGGHERLLIILAKGHDQYRAPVNPLDDIERFQSR